MWSSTDQDGLSLYPTIVTPTPPPPPPPLVPPPGMQMLDVQNKKIIGYEIEYFNPVNKVSTQTTTGLNFPRVAIVGVGGDNNYGFSSSTYNTSGTQLLGSFDLVIGGGDAEAWPTNGGNARDRDLLTKSYKGKNGFTITKNNKGATYVFWYATIWELPNPGSSQTNPTWFNLVNTSSLNWWLYPTTNHTFGQTPMRSAFGGGTFSMVNCSILWPNGNGSFAADSSVCGNVYGGLSTGDGPNPNMGPARTGGRYYSSKNLTKAPTDPRFTSFNTANGAPSADGVFLDNMNSLGNGGGTLSGNASWDGIGTQPPTELSYSSGGSSSLISRGQFKFFTEMQTYLQAITPGRVLYNFGNFTSYGDTHSYGDIHTATGNAVDGFLHGGLLESFMGVAGSAQELWQDGGGLGWNNMRLDYYYAMDYAIAPKLICLGLRVPATDGSTTSIYLPPPYATNYSNGTYTTVTHNSALEYQMLRYALCTVLLDDGFLAIGTNGYNWNLTPWYEEFGDDSLVQVNVKRGYLGQPLNTRTTAAEFPGGTYGIWTRFFQGGVAIVNPRGNGTQTLTAGQLPGTWHRLNGANGAVTGNNGSQFTGATFADGDGLILLRG